MFCFLFPIPLPVVVERYAELTVEGLACGAYWSQRVDEAGHHFYPMLVVKERGF